MSRSAAGPLRRLRLAAAAAGAVLAVAFTAFFYHYLTHIPSARVPRPEEPIPLPEGRDLLLDGLAAGKVFEMTVRDARQLSIELPAAAQRVEPSDVELQAFPPAAPAGESGLGRRQTVAIAMAPASFALISVSVAGERPGLVFTPARTVGSERGFRLRMHRGRMILRVEFRENPAGEGTMTLTTAQAARRVNAAEFVIPAPAEGSAEDDAPRWRASAQVNLAILGLGAASGDAPEVAAPVELPVYREDAPDRPVLAVGAAATGRSEPGGFRVETIACAAEPGRKRLWRSPFPAVRLDRCAPGRLLVDRFDPFAAVPLQVEEGSAFFAGERGAEYWTGPSSVLGNSIISIIFGGLIGSLIAGAGLRVRRAMGGDSADPDSARPRPRRRKRKAPPKA